MEEYHQDEKDESIAKDPEVTYVSQPSPIMPRDLTNNTDIIGEIDLTNEEIGNDLDEFFAEQNTLFEDVSVPEGYITVEEAYKKSIKHLEDLYANKKSPIKA